MGRGRRCPELKSPRSTSNTSTSFSARSRNVPIPLMPPPMINTEMLGFSLREERTSLRFNVYNVTDLTGFINQRPKKFLQRKYDKPVNNLENLSGLYLIQPNQTFA